MQRAWIIPIHHIEYEPEPKTTWLSHFSIIPKYFHCFFAMMFARFEIEKDVNLLRNKTLNFLLIENANNARGSCSGTMGLLFTRQGHPLNYVCSKEKELIVIIGGLITQNSKLMPHILSIYRIPQVCVFPNLERGTATRIPRRADHLGYNKWRQKTLLCPFST